jgi:NAD(P)-dependent dehydrogenase (short-subunit alcohol dehydrogenase family)
LSAGRFDGKSVWLTGGGSGLGRSMAAAFAREGATVCVIGRRQEALDETVDLIARDGGNAFGLACDVRDAARVQEVVATIVERTGRLDVLVNNAAGNFIVPSENLSPNGFKSVVDIVLNGTFHCTRYAFEALRESRGSILNIIATYAWSGEPGALHSACAKAGVLAMTRTLAAEWGPFGIRVNALAPGPIHTEGTDKNLWSVADVEKHVQAQVPLGRLGTPEDVSRAALWLCSSDAEWVSGAALPVDGAHWLHGGTLNFRKAHDRLTSARGATEKA